MDINSLWRPCRITQNYPVKELNLEHGHETYNYLERLTLELAARNKQVSARAYEKCEVSPEHIDSDLMLPIRSTTGHGFYKNSWSYCIPTFS